MPAFPPSRSHRAARQRLATAVASFTPGIVIHNFITQDQGAVTTGPATLMNKEGGQYDGEQLTWRIGKEYFTAAPAVNETVSYNESSWIIREIQGREDWAVEYVITCTH